MLIKKLGRIILPASRRESMKILFLHYTRLTPRFFHRVKKLGITSSPRTQRLVVSLTTYPKRVNTVHRTIATLLSQTLKPDVVVLWLGEDKFPRKEAELPSKLLRLRKFGLTIKWCKDIRSYTKLVPSLREYPNDIIVTADDDIFYRPDWLHLLYNSYQEDPNAISCHQTRDIVCQSGKVLPYSRWKFSQDFGKSVFRHLLMGVGGVLYPPHTLYQDVFDQSLFQRLSPMADDLWFWAMAVTKGTKVKLVSSAQLSVVPDYAANCEDALSNVNIGSKSYNDEQFNNILIRYPKLLELIDESGDIK